MNRPAFPPYGDNFGPVDLTAVRGRTWLAFVAGAMSFAAHQMTERAQLLIREAYEKESG